MENENKPNQTILCIFDITFIVRKKVHKFLFDLCMHSHITHDIVDKSMELHRFSKRMPNCIRLCVLHKRHTIFFFFGFKFIAFRSAWL